MRVSCDQNKQLLTHENSNRKIDMQKEEKIIQF